jgi:hypothetical protein
MSTLCAPVFDLRLFAALHQSFRSRGIRGPSADVGARTVHDAERTKPLCSRVFRVRLTKGHFYRGPRLPQRALLLGLARRLLDVLGALLVGQLGFS